MKIYHYKCYSNYELNRTTISIQKQTHDQLSAIGHKNENFDQIVRRLLEKWSLDH